VKLLARRLHRRCPQVELDDLISAGTIGSSKPLTVSTRAGNLQLKTLAEHRINGALLDYLRHIDPLSRSVRCFQKQRDAAIEHLSAAGEAPGDSGIAQALGVSLRKYVTPSRMITASEPISIHESAIACELTG